MKKLMLIVLLTLTSFISLAASPNNKQCGVFEIAKKYELELNRAWWYQGSLNSGLILPANSGHATK